MAAGVTDKLWEISDIVALIEAKEADKPAGARAVQETLCLMPRFYFDSHDGTLLTHDGEGLEFANVGDAKQALEQFLMGMVRNAKLKADERLAVWVILRDEAGKPLLKQ
ncbi:MAG: hypothetical protein E5W97_21535 [Mesorhizobium sp.]|nr:MAG: hypothetical protein E5W97_21535 [Mesorhizobium sp.]